MKQNITISVEKSLRALAAERGASISSMLALELQKIADRESAYDQARRRALVCLSMPFHLGGKRPVSKEALHDRQNLR